MDKQQQLIIGNKFCHRLAIVALILALMVIMLGAYTRLTDAGLGCPDWPGCYGKIVLMPTAHTLNQAQAVYPQQPLVLHKAWTEMAHRYLASLLGLLIFALAILVVVKYRFYSKQVASVSLLLCLIVMLQALLGMWTVTLQLLPLVVMGHLLGGMSIAALLCWLVNATQSGYRTINASLKVLRPWAIIGLIIIAGQIFLGAWTSTNYAALACPDFPFCQGAFFPPMDLMKAFNLLSPIGPNYEGGHLTMDARVTILVSHRLGAFIALAYLVPFSLCLIFINEFASLQKLGFLLLTILVLQVLLGVLNIIFMLPLPMAVLHNGVAVLLLLTIVTILYRLYCNKKFKAGY